MSSAGAAAVTPLKLTSANVVVFVDSKERTVLDMLSLPAPIGVDVVDDDAAVAPFRVFVGTLAVTDILVCVELSRADFLRMAAEQAAVADADARVSNMHGAQPVVAASDDGDDALGDFLYNPVLDMFDYTASAAPPPFSTPDADKVYMPMLGIERKLIGDLAQSIQGTGATPGFSRLKEQKLRMQALRHLTGCTLMVVVEQYHKHRTAAYIGGVSEESVRTALVNTMLRDKIYVDQSTSELDTVRLLRKTAEQIVDKQFRNFTFPRVVVAARDAARRGMLPGVSTAAGGAAGGSAAAAASVSSERRVEFDEHMSAIALSVQPCVLDSVRATQKLVGAHSQVVSIRKRDNKNPKLCYQMMLMCVHGLSQTFAAAVMREYPTMPALVCAYERTLTEDDGGEQAARRMLAGVELTTRTSTGKARRLGPAKSNAIYEILYARSAATATKATAAPKIAGGTKRARAASTPKSGAAATAARCGKKAKTGKKALPSKSAAKASFFGNSTGTAGGASGAVEIDGDDDELLRDGQV